MRFTQYLFAYGTLQNKEVQKIVLNRTLSGKVTVLAGYRMSKKKVLGKYPLIEPSSMQSDIVQGMLFKVSNFELHEIDQYETSFYRRIQVMVKSGIKAWTYVENFD